MATEELTTAFAVGRNQYLIDTLAFRGILDLTSNQYRVQVARIGSQTWLDVFTINAAALITLPTYLVANLPVGPTGALALASDLLGPTYLGAAVGGGAVTGLVVYNGTGWVTV